MKNVSLETRLQTFANYKTITAVDVNWETLIAMKVNSFLNVTFNTLLIYDEDIPVVVNETTGQTGPRVQYRKIFGVGLTYKF